MCKHLIALLTAMSLLLGHLSEATDGFVYANVNHDEIPPTDKGDRDGEDYVLIEGDIQVSKEYFASRLLSNRSTNSPNATFRPRRWPNNTVPYSFGNGLNDTNNSVHLARRQAVIAAMQLWQNGSGVQFVPFTGGLPGFVNDYIEIQDSTKNSSRVGMIGGRQVVNIESWASTPIIAHELGHALGLWHEQSRERRDDYITVNNANIIKATDPNPCTDDSEVAIDCDHNFDIEADSRKYGPYDFDSVMHYGATDFSRNGLDTITVKPEYAAWQSKIGQRDHLSVMDRKIIGFLYPRSNWRFLTTKDLGCIGGGGTGGCGGDFPLGLPFIPYDRGRFGVAFNATPSGGKLWIEPGTYSTIGTWNKAITLEPTYDTVVLGN